MFTCLLTDQPHSADILYDFLMHNFQRHSSLSIVYRSPFVIQLDLSWLSQHTQTRLQALLRFIEYLLTSPSHRYVYFVSIEKALEWFKYPRSLTDLRDFWALSCHDKTYAYNADCSMTESNENGQEEEEEISQTEKHKTNTSNEEYIDRQAEKLFPSSIAFHAVWISVLLILGVFFYDKYFTNK